LGLAVLGTVLLSILCIAIDAFERLTVFVKEYDPWQLDEAIIVMLFAGVAA
jgi:hypothetical protein